jgi:hypothetical protein
MTTIPILTVIAIPMAKGTGTGTVTIITQDIRP